MARPTITSKEKMQWAGEASTMRQHMNNLWDTVADTQYTTRTGSVENKPTPKPGEIRVENSIIGTGPYERVWCEGEVEFRWCLNRSGGALAQYSLTSRPVNTQLTVTGGGLYYFTDTGLTADELVYGVMNVYDDAGGVSAAPEGESAFIIANTTTRVEFQPDISAVLAVGDVVDVAFPYSLEAAAAGDENSEVQGVVVSPDGIADNYWGWVAYKGRIWAAVNGALTVDKAIIARTGDIAISSTSAFNLLIGNAILATQASAANVVVDLLCGPAAPNMCVSA